MTLRTMISAAVLDLVVIVTIVALATLVNPVWPILGYALVLASLIGVRWLRQRRRSAWYRSGDRW